MYTLIILTRLNGFSLHSFPHTQSGFEEARQTATKACRESETEALIYGPDGFIIWRAGGRQSPVAPAAPVATDNIQYEVIDNVNKRTYATLPTLKLGIQRANEFRKQLGGHFNVVEKYTQAPSVSERLNYSTAYRVCVNGSGDYFSDDGTFMNADGTRSIFDDVDA